LAFQTNKTMRYQITLLIILLLLLLLAPFWSSFEY